MSSVAAQTDHRLGFESLDTETTIGELELEGSVPEWLSGSLVRTGPGRDCTFGVPGETETYPQGWLAQLLEPTRRVGRGLSVARMWVDERRSGGARRFPF